MTINNKLKNQVKKYWIKGKKFNKIGKSAPIMLMCIAKNFIIDILETITSAQEKKIKEKNKEKNYRITPELIIDTINELDVEMLDFFNKLEFLKKEKNGIKLLKFEKKFLI